jgi:hypothetical protein
MTTKRPLPLRRLLIVLALAMNSCASTRPPAQPVAIAAPEPLLGRWEGTWRSQMNQQPGALTCLVSREPDGRHRFDFRATFWKVFHASYSVRLDVREIPGGYALTGSQNLGGFMGGVYRYEGSVSNGVLRATYKSDADHGVFKLTRPREE